MIQQVNHLNSKQEIGLKQMMNHKKHNTSNKIKFKISMIRSNLSDYNDAYIQFKGTITITNTGTNAAPINRNKKVIFKNCALFTIA